MSKLLFQPVFVCGHCVGGVQRGEHRTSEAHGEIHAYPTRKAGMPQLSAYIGRVLKVQAPPQSPSPFLL